MGKDDLILDKSLLKRIFTGSLAQAITDTWVDMNCCGEIDDG